MYSVFIGELKFDVFPQYCAGTDLVALAIVNYERFFVCGDHPDLEVIWLAFEVRLRGFFENANWGNTWFVVGFHVVINLMFKLF
jgi:hypothetical protein